MHINDDSVVDYLFTQPILTSLLQTIFMFTFLNFALKFLSHVFPERRPDSEKLSHSTTAQKTGLTLDSKNRRLTLILKTCSIRYVLSFSVRVWSYRLFILHHSFVLPAIMYTYSNATNDCSRAQFRICTVFYID